MNNKNMQGFTLIEIMIAVVIIGILAAIALPSYNNQVVGSRRADCMATMVGFAQAMEKHYALNYTYEGAATGDGDTGAPANTLYPAQCPTEGTAHYTLTIESASASAFQLKATPKSSSPQSGDGYITINQLGEKEWDTDGNGSIATSEKNWER